MSRWSERHLGIVVVTAALAVVLGCGSDRRGLGAPCRHDNDCIIGAACNFHSCDFVEACSDRQPDDDGDRIRKYRFDAEGRRLGWEEHQGDELVGKEVTTWSSDHREARVETWFSDPTAADSPDLIFTMSYDEDGLLERRHRIAGDKSEAITYEWSESWKCRAPRIVKRDATGNVTTKSLSICNDDGILQRIDHLDGEDVIYSEDYVFEDDRVVQRTTRYIDQDGSSDYRLYFHRDPLGVLTRLEVDMEVDGTIDQRFDYDLSCWEVAGDRVRLRQMRVSP